MADIVLVNDDPDLVEIVQMVLQDDGHEVRTFTDAKKATELIVRAPPDLLVLDWMLRDTTGDEVLRKLRAAPSTSRLPVLVVSGSPGGEEKARLYGADAFLSKPFTADALLRSVAELWQTRGARA
jgi:DNA-binding response OmpR family regulator